MGSIGMPQIRAFVAVADTSSFSAAATQLGISQSAVSHAVAALEGCVGRAVLTRGSPARPTLLGERLLTHARVMLASMASFEEIAFRRDNAPQGNLILAAPSTVCHALAPRLLEHWSVDFPSVFLSLFEGDDDELPGWLEDASVDLAVLVDPVEVAPGAVKLFEDQFHAVLRADHPLAGSAEVDIVDLEDDPFLLPTAGCETRICELFRARGIPFAAAHQARQLSTLFAMVRAGVGVSIVPGLAAGMEGPDLVLIPLTQQVSRTLVLTGPRHRPWHPATTALLSSLKENTDIIVSSSGVKGS